MTAVTLDKPPVRRSILVCQSRLSAQQASQLRQSIVEACERDEWPILLCSEGPVYWLEMGDEMELLRAAHTYISNFVPVSEGEINGFDVPAWCAAVEALDPA
jgi:hypothetical protein